MDPKETRKDRDSKLRELMHSSFCELKESQFIKEFWKQVEDLKLHELYPGQKLKVILYGVGNLEHEEMDIDSRLQVCLVQMMIHKYKWLEDEAEVFDPVLNETEVALLKELGFHVIPVNEECKRSVKDKPILFYMPHLCNYLYENLFKTNWRRENMVLLGNDIQDMISQSKRLRKAEELRCFVALKPFINDCLIPSAVLEDGFTAFEFTSWSFFKVSLDTDLPPL